MRLAVRLVCFFVLAGLAFTPAAARTRLVDRNNLVLHSGTNAQVTDQASKTGPVTAAISGSYQRQPSDTVPPTGNNPLVCGATTYNNGSFDNVNGLASELNTVVSDARTADDIVFANDVTICQITGQLYSTVNPQTAIVEIYADSGGSGPVNAAPIASYPSTSFAQIGSGFGLPIIEFTFSVPSLVLTAGKYWICPIVTDNGSGRGFLCDCKNGVIANQAGYFKSGFFGQTTWAPASTQGQNSDFAFTVSYSDAIPFDSCCIDDFSGDIFREVVANVPPGSQYYGYWEYKVAATGEMFSGTANRVAYRPGLSLIMDDNVSVTYYMHAEIDYARKKCRVQVTDRPTNRHFVLRDRDITNNMCVTAPPPMHQ